ncbi:MAG: hypothetical protein HDT08_05915 [Bacteroidales bacterium]|nr:hypothetical protein [Bacteroidales bacterium]
MAINRLYPQDDVRVEIYYDGKLKDAYQGSGYETIEEAVRAAFEGVKSNANIEDFVYEVKDLTTGTTGRYRVNAGGNVTLLPQENNG